MSPIESVASMQVRMAQISTLVSPTSAATSRAGATGSGTGAEFASSLANAVGLFSGGASASGMGSLAGATSPSGIAAMLGGGSFLGGVSGSSQLSSLASLFPTSPVADAPTTRTPEGPTGKDLVEAAREYLGVKYVWGGESLSEGGLDCSGLVLRSFTDLGVDGIPRVARDQGKIGTAVESMDDAKIGDLLIFDGGSHIGIYIGDGQMIDAPYRGSYVQERKVYETPTAIRRVLG
ncbi:C40 family peptidase [Demequina zhanjiangensis]|uniref:C40 family peptidase n=1 Tax=Demequina zhanjiangensis TaxID=3051659 RepID=A0ABT8FY55_9MICO|nr:C40 family peptidase [Demequina sp. SYSU T00b26]MDN4471838.1 C40 family peptidase [Demequina sp. SYSU T00b26]